MKIITSKPYKLKPTKLYQQLRTDLRAKGYSKNIEDAYVNWTKDFVNYNNKPHPKKLTEKTFNIFDNREKSFYFNSKTGFKRKKQLL